MIFYILYCIIVLFFLQITYRENISREGRPFV